MYSKEKKVKMLEIRRDLFKEKNIVADISKYVAEY